MLRGLLTQGQKQTKTMKKKSSFVWNHFTITGTGTRALCNHCKKEFAYSLTTMSNLGRHIRIKHPEIIVPEIEPAVVDETPVEIYTVEEVEQVHVEEDLKTYEITMKGFEEMEQDIDQSKHDSQDPDWEPDSEEGWKQQKASSSCSLNLKREKKTSKRSAVWDHFKKLPCKTSAGCLHCGRVIKLGTISNLSRHLRHVHPNKPIAFCKTEPTFLVKSSLDNNDEDDDILRNELNITSEVVEINVDSFQNPSNVIETKIDEYESKQKSEVLENSMVDAGNITQASQTEFLSTTDDFDINDYIKPKKTAVVAERADHQLIKMIVKGCHPVSMVKQSAFKEFVSLLNPKYELPSLEKLTKELIPECYRECEVRACKSLQNAEGVCLCIDQWKSKKSNYICVTAHFINTETKFERLFLSCHVFKLDDSATDISQRLIETVNDWEIANKIVAVVTDNTDVISEAVKLCKWPHIPHFIRSLCLIIHESLQSIKLLVSKAKSINEELIKSPQIIAEIYIKQKSLGLPQVKLITKVDNDWSSSFTILEMLVRITKLQTSISHVLQPRPEFKLSESEWKILKSVVDVLDIFREIKKEVFNEERVCMSKIVFYISALKHEMKKFQNKNTLPSDAILVSTVAEMALNKHFKDLDELSLVSNLLLLDPRLKKHAFNDESEYISACSQLKKEVCEVTVLTPEYTQPNPKSFWFSFDEEIRKLNAVKDPIGKGILELENYLQEQLLARDQDPLIWWDSRKAIYPRLFKLMKKYLCVTTKSGQRESISYKSAYMLSHLKCSNSFTSESEIMFLHHNM